MNVKYSHTLLLFFIAIVFSVNGQSNYYAAPVKIPILLSGSFAELRSNHFHSGIDIKTRGQTGVPVYSVADGFISRIVVSPSGFGKAVYIDHPNGTTSVYGHLLSFRTDIESMVKDIQYRQKSFRIDERFPKGKLVVKKNENIAKSGNTGSSGGPHLHFEIRDTKTEEPLNPLHFNFEIKDNISPKIFSVLLRPLNDNSHIENVFSDKIYPAVFYNGKYHLKNNPTILANGNIGIAINTNDYFNDTWNKCGVYSIEMMVNDELYYAHKLDRFSFNESRFLNAHIAYDQYIKSAKRYQKTWVEPGNKLRIYKYLKEDGSIQVHNNQSYKIKLVLKDTYGNTSEISFNLKGTSQKKQVQTKHYTALLNWEAVNYFEEKNIKLQIPENALYNNLKFYYEVQPGLDEFYSEIHKIHKKTVPLHFSSDLQIKPIGIPENLHDKLLMVAVNETGKFYAAGGKYENGWVKTTIRNFGYYAVAADTVPPQIIPLSLKNNTLTESNRLRFKISDDLSGIKKINGSIDGKWALFEYDAKNQLIFHYFDAERFELNKQHKFILEVSDYKNNTSKFKARFWK